VRKSRRNACCLSRLCRAVWRQKDRRRTANISAREYIPNLEFYVLYNGVKPFAEKKVYRLSDSFATPAGADPSLELVVTVYNVNPGFNEEIVRRGDSLYGYVTLVAKARELEQGGLERPKAVEAAIKYCIELGILVGYLNENASEVSNMLFQDWNWDDARAVWEREAEKRERKKWQSVVADMDAALADKDAKLADKDVALASIYPFFLCIIPKQDVSASIPLKSRWMNCPPGKRN